MWSAVLSAGKETATISFPGTISHSGFVQVGNDNKQQQVVVNLSRNDNLQEQAAVNLEDDFDDSEPLPSPVKPPVATDCGSEGCFAASPSAVQSREVKNDGAATKEHCSRHVVCECQDP